MEQFKHLKVKSLKICFVFADIIQFDGLLAPVFRSPESDEQLTADLLPIGLYAGAIMRALSILRPPFQSLTHSRPWALRYIAACKG